MSGWTGWLRDEGRIDLPPSPTSGFFHHQKTSRQREQRRKNGRGGEFKIKSKWGPSIQDNGYKNKNRQGKIGKQKGNGTGNEKKAGRRAGTRIRNRAERPTSILKDTIDVSSLALTCGENQWDKKNGLISELAPKEYFSISQKTNT